jgi:(p)ppGpp synthase/HD superfamily hydrolase
MTQKSPDRDTTIEDIHTTRRRIAEKFGHNLAAIVEDAKKRQATSGHEIWRPKPMPSAASPNP